MIGMTGVGMLMLLITSDVLGRFLFNSPVIGTADLSSYGMVIAVYCSVAYCALVKGHVSLDLIVAKFPQRGQAIIDSVTGFVSLAFFSLIIWRSVVSLMSSCERGEVSLTLQIPSWPFRIILVIGIVILCLVLLLDFFKLLVKAAKR